MKVFGYVLLGIVCVVIAGAIGIREELPTWFIVVFFSASFLGAVIKSATGIGNAFFLAPLLFAYLTAEEAVMTLLVLGIILNLILSRDTLKSSEQNDSEKPIWRAVGLLLAAAIPGMIVGIVLLKVLPGEFLQIALGVLIIFSGWYSFRRLKTASPFVQTSKTINAGVGALAGVFTTTTTLNGPILAIWAIHNFKDSGLARQAIGRCLLGLNVLTLALLIAFGSTHFIDVLPLVLLSIPAMTIGFVSGNIGFKKLAEADHYKTAILVVVVAAGLASIIVGVVSIVQ